MNKILLDTDVIIENFRGNGPILEKIKDLKDEKAFIYISPISIAEVYAGLRSGEEKIVGEFFNSVPCLPINESIGVNAGEYLRLYSRSHGLEVADALIAALSFHSKARLFTLNKKHYPMKDIRLV